ncbi:3',5'-cyclic-nucleotide phosphodiesterase pde1, partial [Ceratobasidium sp. 428]
HEFLFFGDVEADPDPSPPLTPPLSHPSPTPTLTPSSTLDTLPLSTTPPTLSNSILPPLPSIDPTPTTTPCTRPLLLPIWQHTAHLFTSSRLHTLLLECSWPAGHPTARLFGHLGVEQVRKEMRALAAEVVKLKRRKPVSGPTKSKSLIPERNIPPPPTRSRSRESLVPSITTTLTRSLKRKATHLPPISSDPLAGALTGLRVIIIHCKEPSPGFDLAGAPTIADYIVRQLQHGVSHLGIGPNELGVEYVAAHQGDEFGESSPFFFCLSCGRVLYVGCDGWTDGWKDGEEIVCASTIR